MKIDINYVKVSIGVLIILSASRFIPHPPNFTSLLTLSFYVPVAFGLRSIPIVVIAFAITDVIIGFHSTILFTWGSVIIIGTISKFFYKSLNLRIFGALIGAVIFFIITNFGVWLNGMYGYTINGLIACYILALPFFGYSLISTLIFSVVLECIYKIYRYYQKLPIKYN